MANGPCDPRGRFLTVGKKDWILGSVGDDFGGKLGKHVWPIKEIGDAPKA